MIADPSLDAIEAALVRAAPKLDATQRRIAAATYREVATGLPATAAAIAARADVGLEVVARQLEEWTGVFRDGDGSVVGFWGIAIPEMPHRIRVAGADLHAWCAWDPLFLALVLGGLEVETADPVTREPISYRIDGDGCVADVSHPSTVVSFRVPDGEWGDDVITTFCHFVLHFTERSTGERWTAAHPGTTLLTLDQASELGRRFAERILGAGPGSGA